MTLTVYGPAYSTCTMRVLATLYEKEVEGFELSPIELMNGEHRTPEFLKMQPFGKVPVLEDGDGDLTLFESRAIARVIALKFEGQGTALYGTTLEDKALVEQWLEVEAQNFNGPTSAAVFQAVFAPRMFGTPTDEAVLAAQVAKLETVLDVYEKHLAGGTTTKYLAGDFFSLADLSHLPYLHHIVNSAEKGALVESRPAVKAWWEAISSRPAWKKCLEMAAQAISKSF